MRRSLTSSYCANLKKGLKKISFLRIAYTFWVFAFFQSFLQSDFAQQLRLFSPAEARDIITLENLAMQVCCLSPKLNLLRVVPG